MVKPARSDGARSGARPVNLSDDRDLREKAREAIQAGKLPDRRPDHVWGGPGTGAQCTICGAPVGDDDVELEIEFIRDASPRPSRHHVHVGCFSALELERRNFKAAKRAPSPADDRRSATFASVADGRAPQHGK